MTTDSGVAALRTALIENATDLISEARLLLNNGSAARALVLAITAREELAKVSDLDEVDDGETVESRRKAWRSHRMKAMLAIFANVEPALPATWPDGDVEELLQRAVAGYDAVRNAAGDDVERRMAGLYVDYVDGEVRRPRDVVESEAQAMIEGATTLLERIGPALESS